MGLVADRSSMAKRGLKTAGGVIDCGYTGEVQVILWNLSQEPQRIRAGEKIAQLLLMPVGLPIPMEVTSLDETQRGAGGFGSTGF